MHDGTALQTSNEDIEGELPDNFSLEEVTESVELLLVSNEEYALWLQFLVQEGIQLNVA